MSFFPHNIKLASTILTYLTLFSRLSSWRRHLVTPPLSVAEGKYDGVLVQPSSQSHPYLHCFLPSSCLRKSSAKSGIAASQTAQLKSVRIRFIQQSALIYGRWSAACRALRSLIRRSQRSELP